MGNSYRVTSELQLDWLSFSFKYDDLFFYNKKHNLNYNQFDYLFNVAFPELKKVAYVSEAVFRSIYDKCIRMSYDILVYYDQESDQNKGCYVTVPSHSLEYFCTLFNCTNIYQLFSVIIERGGSFSRLDICFDDFSKRFSAIDFLTWYRNGNFNTRLRRYSYHASNNHDTGTFYLGHRAGLKYMRIYDKEYESTVNYNKGKTSEIIKAIRYEFEFHSYAAQALAKYLIENQSVNFRWVVSQFFNIIERDDSNISRCSTLPEWEEFLSELEFSELLVKFKVNVPPASYTSSKYWFMTYCLKTAARIYHHEGEEYLLNKIKETIATECVKDDLDFKIFKEVLT